LEQITLQKQQSEQQLKETERALGLLEDTDEDTTVYRTVGDVMMESDRNETVEELEDEKETLEVRVESLESREEKTQDQFEDLRDEVEQMLGGLGGLGGGGGAGGPAQ